MRRGVFLDRDGVINAMYCDPEHGIVDSPLNPEQFQVIPGVAEAIRLLHSCDFLCVVVSNQPAIAKGKCTHSLLDAITTRMHADLAKEGAKLDGVYYCLHHPNAVLEEYRVACDCRKPKPGLLLQARKDLGIDLSRSYMVGDGVVDIQTAKMAGCTSIWIGDRKCEICQIMTEKAGNPDLIAANLLEATQIILETESLHGDLP